MNSGFSHLDTFAELPVAIGRRAKCPTGDSRWMHFHTWMDCEKIACHYTLPSRRPSKRMHEVSQPICRSAKPRADRTWCYINNVAIVLG